MSKGSLIDAVCHRIRFDKERLEKNELERIEIENFNLSEFWSQFGAAVQSLNNEVTKVGFMCGKKPYPSGTEVGSMMQDLSQHYTIMRDLHQMLPLGVGAVLHRAVTSAVVSIMTSLFDFVKSLHNLSEKGAKERLTLTGACWDACNTVDTLPKDNLQATLQVLGNEVDLASDAKEELETALKEDNEGDDESWTDSERKLAQNALGLAKVTHVCVKWLRDAVRKTGLSTASDQLDVAASIVSTVSPALDDFVSELYHPVDFQTVYDMAERLVGVLRSLLTMVRASHFAEAFSLNNIDKLEHYISHNHQKVDPSVAAVPQLACLSLNSSHVTGPLNPDPCSPENPDYIVVDMDVCDVCGKTWLYDDQDYMKPNAKPDKEPKKEDAATKTDSEDIVKDPLQRQQHAHTKTSDVIVVMVLATILLLYILIKDWLLIAINGVLLCLYVFFIRRRLPLPVYGTMDLVEYLTKIS